MKQFSTRALNVPFPKADPYRALQMPIYESVAFEFETSEDIAANFRGEFPAHAYSRTGNPTVEYFEHKIKTLTHSHQVLAFASGMAAITNAILCLCKAGDNIISGRNMFGHTVTLLSETLPSLGINTRYANLDNPEEIESMIDSNTRLIYFETVTNPQLEIPNIELLASISKKHNIVLMADSTLTPPVIFNSKNLGVDVEVMSTTKFISGGATAVGGIVIDNGTFNWELNPNLAPYTSKLNKDTFHTRLKKGIFRQFGGCMAAHAAYFQILGLDILELRLNRCVDNCLILGEFMEKSKKISQVHYPALKSSKYFSNAQKYFEGKPGAIMTFDLETEAACFKFMNHLKIIRRATNLNDNKSLIIHPYSTIYVEFTPEQRYEMGIRPTMMRLSVGIEGVSDLIEDIEQALLHS